MNKFFTTALGRLRLIGFLEGLSYLVLLGIAMPLKYYFDQPMAVRHVGMAHGVLFVLYVVAVFHAAFVRKWSFLKVLWALLASLIPFGTFYLERQLVREECEAAYKLKPKAYH